MSFISYPLLRDRNFLTQSPSDPRLLLLLLLLPLSSQSQGYGRTYSAMRKWAGTGSSKEIKRTIADLLWLRCVWALERGEKVNRGGDNNNNDDDDDDNEEEEEEVEEDVYGKMHALAAAIHAADASMTEDDARHQPSLLFLSLAAALREAPTWIAATDAVRTVPLLGEYNGAQGLCQVVFGIFEARLDDIFLHARPVETSTRGEFFARTTNGNGPADSIKKIFKGRVGAKEGIARLVAAAPKQLEEASAKLGFRFPYYCADRSGEGKGGEEGEEEEEEKEKEKEKEEEERRCTPQFLTSIDIEHSLCYFSRVVKGRKTFSGEAVFEVEVVDGCGSTGACGGSSLKGKGKCRVERKKMEIIQYVKRRYAESLHRGVRMPPKSVKFVKLTTRPRGKAAVTYCDKIEKEALEQQIARIKAGGGSGSTSLDVLETRLESLS